MGAAVKWGELQFPGWYRVSTVKGVDGNMEMMVNFLHRYLAPFIAGMSMAAATVVHHGMASVLLVLTAGVFAYVSLPAGGRTVRRLAGVPS